jgi:hypothetical protein
VTNPNSKKKPLIQRLFFIALGYQPAVASSEAAGRSTNSMYAIGALSPER